MLNNYTEDSAVISVTLLSLVIVVETDEGYFKNVFSFFLPILIEIFFLFFFSFHNVFVLEHLLTEFFDFLKCFNKFMHCNGFMASCSLHFIALFN